MIDTILVYITFISILVYKSYLISPCYSPPDVPISMLEHSEPRHLGIVKSLNVESKQKVKLLCHIKSNRFL